MKHLLLLLLTFIGICVHAQEAGPINLVFIGNSITYGAQLSSPSTQAPPVKVAAMVREKTGREVYFRNCGLSGSATPQWLPGQTLFTNADNAATELQKANPGTLFFSIMLGTNDTHEGWKTTPENYYRNMRSIVEGLLTRHPEAHIILNYPTWYSPNTHNGAVYLQAGLDRLKTYMPMITRLGEFYKKSARPQVWVGDPTVFSFFENQTQYFVAENGNSGVFYLHPNTTGGTKLAEFWSKSILEHLDGMAPLHTADELLMDRARLAVARCLRADKHSLTAENRLSTAGHVSTNAVAGAGCKVDDLTDLNPATRFEVNRLSIQPNTTPWLQVDLGGKAVNQLVMSMQKCAEGQNLLPSDVTLYGSTDGTAWVRLTALHDIAAKTSCYVSPILTVGKEYRFLRIGVNDVKPLCLSDGGALVWNMSELQLYAVEPDLADSPYTLQEGLRQACDELTAAIAECSSRLAAGSLTDVQRKKLTEATAQVEALYKGEEDGDGSNPNIVYVDDLTSTDTYCYDQTKGLLTLKMYLKVNSEEKNSGTYFGPGNLLSTSTDYNTIIWHTDWTTNPLPAGVDNYLQAHLKAKQSSICFSMIGSNWSGTYDTPDRMVIMATNTPSDESSWTQIVELPDLIPKELHSVHPAFYYSPRIDLGREYSDIRFVVKETVNHRLNRNGNIHVNLARFQVYQPTLVDNPVIQLQRLVTQLTQKNVGIEPGTAVGCYPQENVDAFRGTLSLAALITNMHPTEEEAVAMAGTLKAAWEALEQSRISQETGLGQPQESPASDTTYTLSGVRAMQTAANRGIYIKDRKKVLLP